MNPKKLLATVSLTVLSVLFLIPQTGALDSGIEVEGIDTIAGYSALLRISNAPSDTDLEVWVEKPDGSDVVLEATTDKYGKAKIDLEGFYTKKAGEYSVKAKPVGSREEFGSTETFTVYADQFQDFLVESGWTIERDETADWVTLETEYVRDLLLLTC